MTQSTSKLKHLIKRHCPYIPVAVEPNELQRIIREAIQNHIDANVWNETTERSRSERAELQRRLEELAERLRQP